ncbi:hypothetical protein FQA39_LY11231 [Lamprigera yunnana]|nr:hypothetical protein FQA39_LY11231 [Lamprigera yunnana]
MMAIRSFLFVYFCIFSAYVLVIIHTENVAKLPYCNDNVKQTELIFVSTLDGKFSALSPEGNLNWQISTGPGSLLNSNIHKLELTNNGQWIRIIPSLSGSLYKFNGITIDPMPISADSLLSSSFKYLDDLAVAGGREVRTYGMLLNSGKQLYECSLNGCQNLTNYASNMDNIIIIERKTHTVRAIEPRTGIERWNFSVGQHNLKIPYLNCIDVNMKSSNFKINAILPEGLLIANEVNKANEFIWQYKFDAPIVAVWQWNGREVIPLNVFSSSNIVITNFKQDTPSIYVGMHKKQLYVHESIQMQNILKPTQKMIAKESVVVDSRSLMQIPWKPVSAVSRAMDSMDEDDSTALSVLYASEYVNGNGYYLFMEDRAVCDNNGTNTTTSYRIASKLSISWWKEALIISVITIVVCNIVAYKYAMYFTDTSKSQSTSSTSQSEEILNTSRYNIEFDPISCLGRGGFGVVFQAKKKFDECDYAVKRITLPNKPGAKDRMMREVKALAKLDHKNIVRYYNAWLECPPMDWQKKHDQQWISDFSSFGSASVQSNSHISSSYVSNIESYNVFEPKFTSLSIKDDIPDDSLIVFEHSTALKSSITDLGTQDSKKGNNCVSSKSHSFAIPTINAPVYLYIQMQLCSKESLKDWLHTYPSRNKEYSLAIFGQIVDAVEYVHFRGLIHRDLKPSNIFFSLEGQIKIGDFGLVTSIEEYDDEDEVYNASCKRSYTNAVGTRLYMSPEQLSGQQYNYKVDIYSLGIIFFELLVPFKTEMERIHVLTDIRNHKYPEGFTVTCLKELNLLDSMLSNDPEDRPHATGIREKLYLDDINKIEDYRIELKLPVTS